LLIWETQTGARLPGLAQHGNLNAAWMSADGRVIANGAGGFVGLLDCDVCVPMKRAPEARDGAVAARAHRTGTEGLRRSGS
jgi:hypothetical protein